MLSAWRGALLLLVALWSWGAILAAGGQPIGSRVCKYECSKFTTEIPLMYLRSYEKTKCGKSGVLLITKRNKTFCANPEDKWVQNAMRELDSKNVLVTEDPGRFDKHLGSVIPVSAQTGHSAHPTETFSTTTYELSTFSVTRRQDSESSAVSSTLVGPQVSKPSPGSASKPELIVSKTTMQPKTLANRSTPSYFTDGPKSFGEGHTPVGKDLEDNSGSMSDLVGPPTSLGTNTTEAVNDVDHKVSPTQSTLYSSSTIINLLKKNSTSSDRLLSPSDRQHSAITQVTENSTLGFFTVPQRVDITSPPGTHTSTNRSKTNSVKNRNDIGSVPGEATEAPLSTQANRDASSKSSGTHEEHFSEKSRGEATTPSLEVSLPFLPNSLTRYRSHIISLVFLGFAFCIYLTITGICAKSHICTQASPLKMVQGLTYSKIDPQSTAYPMQVL